MEVVVVPAVVVDSVTEVVVAVVLRSVEVVLLANVVDSVVARLVGANPFQEPGKGVSEPA